MIVVTCFKTYDKINMCTVVFVKADNFDYLEACFCTNPKTFVSNKHVSVKINVPQSGPGWRPRIEKAVKELLFVEKQAFGADALEITAKDKEIMRGKDIVIKMGKDYSFNWTDAGMEAYNADKRSFFERVATL